MSNNDIAALICREVAELPDRNSPEDWPEAMLVTHDELHRIILGALPARVTWPQGRDVGRLEDMGQGHMRVGLDSDNDVYVEVFCGERSTSVEFCNPGGGGGGQSSRTRIALIALMVAIEADNAERPSRDFWARRNGANPTPTT